MPGLFLLLGIHGEKIHKFLCLLVGDVDTA